MPTKPKKVRAVKKTVEAKVDLLTADQVAIKMVKWLVEPWITRAEVTLVVGAPNVGKSTFVAWLLRCANRPLVFPGREESLSSKTIPRWKEATVKLDRVGIMNDRDYRFPRDGSAVAEKALAWGCDLIVFDPIDSYYSDSIGENDGPGVREYLESLASLADLTGAAVVGIRHPGKDPANLLPGSRQWYAVPRNILALTPHDDERGVYVCSFFKDSNGGGKPPRRYTLQQAHPTVPRVFVWGEQVSEDADKLSRSAETATDRIKVTEACLLLYSLMREGVDPAVTEFVKQCQALGIGERSATHAKRLLGVRSRPMAHGGAWILVRPDGPWPDWLLAAFGGEKGVSPG